MRNYAGRCRSLISTTACELTEEAVELLDEICARSPDVFNYQIARARALGRYVATLDQNAELLESSPDADEQMKMMGQILRYDATDEAIRAAELFATWRDRLGEAFLDRLPASSEVALAEVIAKSNSETAIPYFREASAATERSPCLKARADIGLARSLVYTDFHGILSRYWTMLGRASTRVASSTSIDSSPPVAMSVFSKHLRSGQRRRWCTPVT